MLRLVLGTDWVSVRNGLLERIARDVAAEKPGRILLVPELISHDMERRLCAAAGDTASRFAEVLTFTRLVRRVSEYAGVLPGDCMDAGGRMVAMAAAARQLHSRLKAYAAVETKPEFLSELLEAVDEFKRCCISPGLLAAAAEQSQGGLAQKLEELSLLLSAYDSVCAQGKMDPADRVSWMLSQLECCDFGREHVFYIDGFPDFTRQHMAVLEHLISTSQEVTVGLNCDRPNSDGLAFEKPGDTAARLLRFAQAAGIPAEIIHLEDRPGPLGASCRSLFQGRLPQGLSCVQAVAVDGPVAEVEYTADRIMELVRSGCRFRDISVVCSDLNAYGDYIQLLFPRWGIPVYQSGTEDILSQSVIAMVLAALEAAAGALEQRDVLRYLRSALSPLSPEECDLVENYAVIWGVHGKRWLEPWTQHPDGLSGIWNDRTQGELERLNRSRILAMEPLARLRHGIAQAENLGSQVQALFDFLEELALAQRLEVLARELEESGNGRGAQILSQLWEILLSALEQLQGVLGDTAWDGDTFQRLLTLLLRQYDVGTIPPSLDTVTVGGVSAMRCQQAKHVFILGVSEGALPGYPGSTGLLSDQERTALRALGMPLTGGAMEGIQAEFSEIYGVFSGAEETVTMTCSGQPSFLFRRLAQMSGGEVHPEPSLGSALWDRRDAAAALAALEAEKAAQALSLDEEYRAVRSRTQHSLGIVERAHIAPLYGKRLTLSASQVDTQAQCRLYHFLRYGLRARERKEASIDPAEFGTYVHAVLEKTAKRVMELGGFSRVSMEQTLEIARQFSGEYAENRFSQMDSQRLKYLLQRNRQELDLIVTELWQELKASGFAPVAFELNFDSCGEMPEIAVPSAAMEAVLRGYVDRVDLWEDQGKRYFRVVDYKTGSKDFDYCDVYNGVGLQMLLYLFALERSGGAVVGDAQAAGVQYFPARVPVLPSDGKLTAQQAEDQRKKHWVRKGLLLDREDVLQAMDPSEEFRRLCCDRKKDGSIRGDLASREELQLLRQYVFGLLGDMVEEIASGEVSPNPYTRGSAHDPCTYCPYGSICHSDTVALRRNYKAMDRGAFWSALRSEGMENG